MKDPFWCPDAGKYAKDGVVYSQANGMWVSNARCAKWGRCRDCATEKEKKEKAGEVKELLEVDR